MWVTTGGGIGRFSRPGGVRTRLLLVDDLLVECVLGNDNGETDSAEVYMRFSMVKGAMDALVLLRVVRVSLFVLTSCWLDEVEDETGEDKDEAVELRSGLEYLGGGLLW
jgi:hypothetical protein